MMTKQSLSRRQFLSLVAGASSVAMLAACTPAGSDGAASSEAAPGEATTNLIAWFTDRLTINQMTQNEAIPDFQSKNPSIQVEMQFVPESELQQKLLTAKAAGNAPDISSIDETFLDTLQKEGVLLPIPEEVLNVQEEMGELTATLYRIPPGTDDARFYGLPNGVFAGALYYNVGLLDELGYTPEDIPTTWDEFVAWAKEVTVWDGNTLSRAGFAIYGSEDSLQQVLRHHLAGPLDGNPFATKDSIRLADSPGVSAWQFIMDLYDVHQVDSRTEGLLGRDRFGAGNAVTMYNWTWFNGFMDTQYPEVDWGIMLDPTFSDGPIYGNRGPDVGFTVTSQQEANMDATWTLYRYLVSPDYLAKYCKLRGIQPSLTSMWNDPEFSADSGPHWAAVAVKNRPENSVDWGFNPRELTDIVGRSLPAIRDEGEDITTVLQRNEADGNAFLQGNPQWSILSAADYEANPQWLQPVG